MKRCRVAVLFAVLAWSAAVGAAPDPEWPDAKSFKRSWTLPDRRPGTVCRHDNDCEGVYRYANLLWSVRAVDSRFPERDPVAPFEQQLETSDRYELPRSVLFTFDALYREDLLAVARRHEKFPVSYGMWYEIVEVQCAIAGIEWKSSHPGWTWDWHVNPGHSMAYTQDERRRLADVAMKKFKAVFGSYPKIVAAWMLDAWTIEYLSERYGVEAFAFCREQDSIDAYGYRGGYFDGLYYPSKVNHLCAARDFANAVKTPVFRMYTTCPIYTYGKDYQTRFASPGWCGTFEPVWLTGHHPLTVNYSMDMHFESKGLMNFSGIVTGQENIPWGWPRQAKGVENVCRELAKRWKAGEFQMETMDETARAFKRRHPQGNPPITQISLEDWAGQDQQTVWYNCRNYRLNVHRDGTTVLLRDCHRFDDAYAEKYYEQPCRNWNAEYFTLPVFDSYMYGEGRSGRRGAPVLNGEFTSIDITSSDERKLEVTTLRKDGTSARIVLDESGFSVYGAELTCELKRGNRDLSWRINGRGLSFAYDGFEYDVEVKGKWTAVDGDGWRLQPDGDEIRVRF